MSAAEKEPGLSSEDPIKEPQEDLGETRAEDGSQTVDEGLGSLEQSPEDTDVKGIEGKREDRLKGKEKRGALKRGRKAKQLDQKGDLVPKSIREEVNLPAEPENTTASDLGENSAPIQEASEEGVALPQTSEGTDPINLEISDINSIEEYFRETEDKIRDSDVASDIKTHWFKILGTINGGIDKMIKLQKGGAEGWKEIKTKIEEDLISLNETIDKISNDPKYKIESSGQVSDKTPEVLAGQETPVVETVPVAPESVVEKSEKEAKLEKEKGELEPKKKRLLEAVREKHKLDKENGTQELKEFFEKLQGKRVYQFKDGKRQYLKLGRVQIEKGEKIADKELVFEVFDAQTGEKTGEVLNKIKDITYREWKKSEPTQEEVGKSVQFRDDKGGFGSRLLGEGVEADTGKTYIFGELSVDQVVKYQDKKGKIAYAQRTPERPTPPKPETPAAEPKVKKERKYEFYKNEDGKWGIKPPTKKLQEEAAKINEEIVRIRKNQDEYIRLNQLKYRDFIEADLRNSTIIPEEVKDGVREFLLEKAEKSKELQSQEAGERKVESEEKSNLKDRYFKTLGMAIGDLEGYIGEFKDKPDALAYFSGRFKYMKEYEAKSQESIDSGKNITEKNIENLNAIIKNHKKKAEEFRNENGVEQETKPESVVENEEEKIGTEKKEKSRIYKSGRFFGQIIDDFKDVGEKLAKIKRVGDKYVLFPEPIEPAKNRLRKLTRVLVRPARAILSSISGITIISLKSIKRVGWGIFRNEGETVMDDILEEESGRVVVDEKPLVSEKKPKEAVKPKPIKLKNPQLIIDGEVVEPVIPVVENKKPAGSERPALPPVSERSKMVEEELRKVELIRNYKELVDLCGQYIVRFKKEDSEVGKEALKYFTDAFDELNPIPKEEEKINKSGPEELAEILVEYNVRRRRYHAEVEVFQTKLNQAKNKNETLLPPINSGSSRALVAPESGEADIADAKDGGESGIKGKSEVKLLEDEEKEVKNYNLSNIRDALGMKEDASIDEIVQTLKNGISGKLKTVESNVCLDIVKQRLKVDLSVGSIYNSSGKTIASVRPEAMLKNIKQALEKIQSEGSAK